MATLLDPTPLLTTIRFLTAAYALLATVLTTACLTLHLVTRFDRVSLRRRTARTTSSARRLFVPLDQSPAGAA